MYREKFGEWFWADQCATKKVFIPSGIMKQSVGPNNCLDQGDKVYVVPSGERVRHILPKRRRCFLPGFINSSFNQTRFFFVGPLEHTFASRQPGCGNLWCRQISELLRTKISSLWIFYFIFFSKREVSVLAGCVAFFAEGTLTKYPGIFDVQVWKKLWLNHHLSCRKMNTSFIESYSNSVPAENGHLGNRFQVCRKAPENLGAHLVPPRILSERAAPEGAASPPLITWPI